MEEETKKFKVVMKWEGTVEASDEDDAYERAKEEIDELMRIEGELDRVFDVTIEEVKEGNEKEIVKTIEIDWALKIQMKYKKGIGATFIALANIIGNRWKPINIVFIREKDLDKLFDFIDEVKKVG